MDDPQGKDLEKENTITNKGKHKLNKTHTNSTSENSESKIQQERMENHSHASIVDPTLT